MIKTPFKAVQCKKINQIYFKILINFCVATVKSMRLVILIRVCLNLPICQNLILWLFRLTYLNEIIVILSVIVNRNFTFSFRLQLCNIIGLWLPEGL